MRVLFGVLCVTLVGCGERPALEVGRELWGSPSVSTAESNRFRCATCHEIAPEPTRLRAGYTMHEVVGRPAFWGGFVSTLHGAVNQCVTDFMKGRELSEADEKGRALAVYLRSVSPSPSAPALPLTVVFNIVDVPSGDAARGKPLFEDGCATCHGDPQTGRGRISDKATVVPDDTIREHGDHPTLGARPIVIEKVRHGKYYNVGGEMPLYSLEALSDAQLGDILAYLETFGLPKSR